MNSEPPSFDAQTLARRINDDELVDEVLREFLQRADEDVAAIRRAVLADDVPTVRVRAHSFRGLLATLTAERASRIAADIEETVDVAPSDVETLTRLVERLAFAVERACWRMRQAICQPDDGCQGADAASA